MIHRLSVMAAATSFLLCVAFIVLWVRSIGHCGGVFWIGPGHTVQWMDVDGVAGILAARDHSLYPSVGGTGKIYGWFVDGRFLEPGRDRASLSTVSFNRWGFGFHLRKTVGRPRGNWALGGRRLWIAYVPYWLLVLITGTPPLVCVTQVIRRARRRSTGLCPTAATISALHPTDVLSAGDRFHRRRRRRHDSPTPADLLLGPLADPVRGDGGVVADERFKKIRLPLPAAWQTLGDRRRKRACQFGQRSSSGL